MNINNKIDSLSEKSECSWFHKDEVKQILQATIRELLEKKIKVKVGYLDRDAVLVNELNDLI